MKLTGIAAQLFNKWYDDVYTKSTDFKAKYYTDFDYLSPSMKWGVYQDFADSLGYDIYVTYYSDLKDYVYHVHSSSYKQVDVGFSTRQEAQEEAVNELINIINKK